MTTLISLARAVLFSGLAAFAVSSSTLSAASAQKAVLFDGSNLDRWTTIGDANWKIVDGVVQADQGKGFLVTKDVYKDFRLRVEFWVNEDTNSGVFARWADLNRMSLDVFYEINIYDKRPDQSYASGSIVGLAKANEKVAGRWNTFDIIAEGRHLVVMLNGKVTADVEDAKLERGHIGLQKDLGAVKFRKVEIETIGP